MPFLRIQTNRDVSGPDRQALVRDASTLVAGQLGKPERYVMVAFEPNPAMVFGGEDAPLAYLELKSIGLAEDQTAGLSEALCGLVNDRLGIDQDRVYIEFADAPRKMWGWNGGTF